MEEHNPQPLAADPLGARSAGALRELQDRAQAAIAARREQAARLEADITARFETLAASIAEVQFTNNGDNPETVDQVHAEVKRLSNELEDARAAMKLERAAWESEREALEKERASAGVERANFTAERAAWETERSTFYSERAVWDEERANVELERKSWNAERAAWDTERNKHTANAAQLEAELRTAEAERRSVSDSDQSDQEEFRSEFAEFERKLIGERATHEQGQAAWAKERSEFQAQLDEAQQKFELALEDVQRLRAKVTELEQDLARRPETDKTDSAELIALRAECDVLASRVEELERAPAAQPDTSADQELEDLRRRFEMAVQDVRELKGKNAKLEGQVASAKQQSGKATDSGSMDWESQKRRLLASLEDCGAESDPMDQKERATIENTIEMTDAIVAEKDQLIAELKSQLAEGGAPQPDDAEADREAELNKLLDADAVIVEHRSKTAQLEQEMEGKLRTAELELSVERAKIARQRVELEELRIELDSQRHSQGLPESPASPGAPKRRWLSKLGLTGDE